MILAGDVGGTKTHLALFPPRGDVRAPALERRLPSRAYPTFESLVREFLSGAPARPEVAVFGVAGPVVNGAVDATNLPWHLDARALGQALGVPRVELVNDLESTAWGLGALGPPDFEVLQAGVPTPGNRALIAAGTGLGEGILAWNGRDWRPSPSEGGHTDFGPRDGFEDALLGWLRARHGRVSYERILSGPGLADLYRFLTETGQGEEPAEVGRAFASAPDPAVVVSRSGLDGSCPRARIALERWVSIYGAEAGNLALKALAVGGVFVGGGIAPRLLAVMRSGGFVQAFTAKGRLSPVLARVPVRIILDDRTALWGAAALAFGEAS